MLPTLEELTDNFSLFDDWEQKYQYLIELGGKLPPMEDALKTEATEVKGCVSKVWLYAQRAENGAYHFQADSDGNITRGLVYIVLCAYEGKRGDEIGAIDVDAAFETMGLSSQLSPNRRNGFFAMVEKIRALAA